MSRARLMIVLAMAVLFAQLQCVAACAGDVCPPDRAQPPCHQHHSDSHDRGSCGYRLLASPANLPQTVQMQAPELSGLSHAALVIVPLIDDPQTATLDLTPVSPPLSQSNSSVILRV